MTLITCDLDCKYQKDGYCDLNESGYVTNSASQIKCVHYVKRIDKKGSRIILTKPEKPL